MESLGVQLGPRTDTRELTGGLGKQNFGRPRAEQTQSHQTYFLFLCVYLHIIQLRESVNVFLLIHPLLPHTQKSAKVWQNVEHKSVFNDTQPYYWSFLRLAFSLGVVQVGMKILTVVLNVLLIANLSLILSQKQPIPFPGVQWLILSFICCLRLLSL